MGLAKGLVRQIIGILAVIAGLILAVNYYSDISRFLERFILNELVSDFLGFIIIFLGVLFFGGLISHLFSKLAKGPFRFFDRLLGAGLGLLKGVLISAIIVFALLVFPVNKTVVKESQLAPFTLGVTKALIHLIPQELKEKFREKYREISRKVKKHEKRI